MSSILAFVTKAAVIAYVALLVFSQMGHYVESVFTQVALVLR